MNLVSRSLGKFLGVNFFLRGGSYWDLPEGWDLVTAVSVRQSQVHVSECSEIEYSFDFLEMINSRTSHIFGFVFDGRWKPAIQLAKSPT